MPLLTPHAPEPNAQGEPTPPDLTHPPISNHAPRPIFWLLLVFHPNKPNTASLPGPLHFSRNPLLRPDLRNQVLEIHLRGNRRAITDSRPIPHIALLGVRSGRQ